MADFEKQLDEVFTRLASELNEEINRVFDEADTALVALGERLCPGARFPMRDTVPLDPVAEASAYAEYRWGKNDPEALEPVWWSEEILNTYCVTDGSRYFFGCTDPEYPGHVQEVFVRKNRAGKIADVCGISVPLRYKNIGPLLPGQRLSDEPIRKQQVFWY